MISYLLTLCPIIFSCSTRWEHLCYKILGPFLPLMSVHWLLDTYCKHLQATASASCHFALCLFSNSVSPSTLVFIPCRLLDSFGSFLLFRILCCFLHVDIFLLSCTSHMFNYPAFKRQDIHTAKCSLVHQWLNFPCVVPPFIHSFLLQGLRYLCILCNQHSAFIKRCYFRALL